LSKKKGLIFWNKYQYQLITKQLLCKNAEETVTFDLLNCKSINSSYEKVGKDEGLQLNLSSHNGTNWILRGKVQEMIKLKEALLQRVNQPKVNFSEPDNKRKKTQSIKIISQFEKAPRTLHKPDPKPKRQRSKSTNPEKIQYTEDWAEPRNHRASHNQADIPTLPPIKPQPNPEPNPISSTKSPRHNSQSNSIPLPSNINTQDILYSPPPKLNPNKAPISNISRIESPQHNTEKNSPLSENKIFTRSEPQEKIVMENGYKREEWIERILSYVLIILVLIFSLIWVTEL